MSLFIKTKLQNLETSPEEVTRAKLFEIMKGEVDKLRQHAANPDFEPLFEQIKSQIERISENDIKFIIFPPVQIVNVAPRHVHPANIVLTSLTLEIPAILLI